MVGRSKYFQLIKLSVLDFDANCRLIASSLLQTLLKDDRRKAACRQIVVSKYIFNISCLFYLLCH